MLKVFVGSSTAARLQAKYFMKGCACDNVRFLPWWEQFVPGNTLLEELSRIRKSVDRAILILSPESTTMVRRTKHAIPNLNVLFEFGFFYSALGKDNVAVVRYGKLYLPSDLDGYIHITGSNHFTRGHGVVVGKRTKEEFNRWLFPHGRPAPPVEDTVQILPKFVRAMRTVERDSRLR